MLLNNSKIEMNFSFGSNLVVNQINKKIWMKKKFVFKMLKINWTGSEFRSNIMKFQCLSK